MYRIYENGIYRDATTKEIEELEKIQQENQNQVQDPTLDDKIVSLQEENQMLKECILEMSEIVYGG
ncbi:MAG: hypothetical protein ACLT5Y_16865 [Thomasclavelia ramosa]